MLKIVARALRRSLSEVDLKTLRALAKAIKEEKTDGSLDPETAFQVHNLALTVNKPP